MQLLLWVVLLLAPFAAYAANGETVNVVDAGLVPDSPLNQSAAFRAIMTAHGDDTTYFFPAGTYILSNLTVTNVKRVTFAGVGAASIWQYQNPPTSYVNIYTCYTCEDITFKDVGIDNRHIYQYGGLRFYHVKRLTVTRVQFTDSLPRTSYTNDVYALAVSFEGLTPINDTITITDSFFFQQALEIDHSQHVTVTGNTFYNTQSTAAIGAFSAKPGTSALDWWVAHNHIIHPRKCAICFNLDPSSNNDTTWRTLRVLSNTIQRIKGGGYNIRFGTGNTSVKVTGTVFDDILTDGNSVEYLGVTPDQPLVKLSGSPSLGITFTNTHIED